VESVGQRIKRLRHALGLTMVELGATAGLTNSAISRIESSSRTPAVETLRLLAPGLGVTADYLEFGIADEVVVRAPVDRVDAAAEQFGVPLGWRDLTVEERDRILRGLDVALIDSLVAGLYAAHRNRRVAAGGTR
jgi:transcriptional regulator with XRE-family HTH domain